MERIGSFFKKSDNLKKKQRDVKQDEVQPSNLEPNNYSSAELTSESSSDPVKVTRHFHLEWKATFPWVFIYESLF